MKGSSLAACVVVALAAGVPGPAAAIGADCELDGQRVNLDNGSTTAGKSGMVVCRDRESGKIVREERWVNGRQLGYRKSTDLFGNVIVANVNERGNLDGEYRSFHPTGRPRSEEAYRDGSRIGLGRFFNRDGGLEKVSFAEPRKGELAVMAFNARGQLTELRCADRPLLPDDRKPCGFDGPAETDLFNARGEPAGRVRHAQGRRVATTVLGAGGVRSASEEVDGARTIRRAYHGGGELRLETTFVDGRRRAETEYAREGQKLREAQWDERGLVQETQWFMNGSLKRKEAPASGAPAGARALEEYWDNGRLRSRGVVGERGQPLGLVQTWRESGTPWTEVTYDKGRPVRKREFDAGGALVSDDEYYEDGSRKPAR